MNLHYASKHHRKMSQTHEHWGKLKIMKAGEKLGSNHCSATATQL